MKRVLAMAVVTVLGACDIEPPPAWTPDDFQLVAWADSDETWALFAAGCEAWREGAGLRWARVMDRSWATVEVRLGDTGSDATGVTRYEAQVDGSWSYDVVLATALAGPDGGGGYAEAVAAHEVGHLLGIWDHLDDSAPALMTAAPSSFAPTARDVAALP